MSSSYIGPNFINAFLNKYGTSIEINFDSDLGDIPLKSSFGLKVNGIVRNISSITKIKNTLLLNPEISISNTDAITLSYTDPTTGNDNEAIQDKSGNDSQSISSIPITNKIQSYISSGNYNEIIFPKHSEWVEGLRIDGQITDLNVPEIYKFKYDIDVPYNGIKLPTLSYFGIEGPSSWDANIRTFDVYVVDSNGNLVKDKYINEYGYTIWEFGEGTSEYGGDAVSILDIDQQDLQPDSVSSSFVKGEDYYIFIEINNSIY